MWVQSPGQEDSLEDGMATHSQHSCQENSRSRGAWQATVQGVERVRHDRARRNV